MSREAFWAPSSPTSPGPCAARSSTASLLPARSGSRAPSAPWPALWSRSPLHPSPAAFALGPPCVS